MDQLTLRPAPPPRVERPRRTKLLVVLIAFLVLAGVVVAGATYYSDCRRPPPPRSGTVSFVVPRGATGEQVAADLHARGLVSCGGVVGNLLLGETGKADKVLAGTYTLSIGMSLDRIMQILSTPPKSVPTVRLTIPPGFTLEQIADRVHRLLGIPTKTFLAEAGSGDYALPPYLPKGRSLEGFLFPETYRIPTSATAADVIQRLLDQFADEAAALPWDRADALGMTPYQVVIVASMIEKEAKVARDRPLISGVIRNRLRKGMELGIDATLLYDDPTPDGQLSTSDLRSDSPYNTRIHAGLPPTPIASPYLWSLRAALDPAKTPFFYYVLCGADGHHKFAVTLSEHLRNVHACLG